MSEPTEFDIMAGTGRSAVGNVADFECLSHLDEVQDNINSVGYPKEYIHFIEGDIKTINTSQLQSLALLRLNVDWYDNTKSGLQKLQPKVVHKGMVVIDDYGYWLGCKRATEEFLTENPRQINFTDNDGIFWIEP